MTLWEGMGNPILLSLDVEEFDLPREYGLDIDDAKALEVSRRGLVKVMALIDRLDITVTCFTTAHFASNYPSLIKDISRRHEIACHGYTHSDHSSTNIYMAKAILEEIISKGVVGYRHPRLGAVATKTLTESGFLYDSSVNPTWLPGRYMNLNMRRLPFRDGELWVLPISVTPLVRFPLFWLSFKGLPMGYYKALTAWTIKWDGYLNIYFHPWEFEDLSDLRVPFMIKKPSGDALLKRLGEFLLWLKGNGDFMNMGRYLEEVKR